MQYSCCFNQDLIHQFTNNIRLLSRTWLNNRRQPAKNCLALMVVTTQDGEGLRCRMAICTFEKSKSDRSANMDQDGLLLCRLGSGLSGFTHAVGMPFPETSSVNLSSRFGDQSESVLQLYELPQFQPEQELLPQSIQCLEAQSFFSKSMLAMRISSSILAMIACLPRVHPECCVVLRWTTSTRQGLFGATPLIQRFVGRTGAD